VTGTASDDRTGLLILGYEEYVEPHSGRRTSGSAETFDAARVAFRESWDKWRVWATKTGFDCGAG
jgi:hypothetical protein